VCLGHIFHVDSNTAEAWIAGLERIIDSDHGIGSDQGFGVHDRACSRDVSKPWRTDVTEMEEAREYGRKQINAMYDTSHIRFQIGSYHLQCSVFNNTKSSTSTVACRQIDGGRLIECDYC